MSLTAAKGAPTVPTITYTRLKGVRTKKETDRSWPPGASPTSTGPHANTMDIDDDQILEVFDGPPPLPPEAALDAVISSAQPNGVWAIASAVAREIGSVFRARTVLVHAYDVRRGDLRLIGVDGPGTIDLLGSTDSADEDFVARTLLTNQRSLTICFGDGRVPRLAPERIHALGARQSLVAVPARVGGRIVGIVEILDAEVHLGEVACKAAKIADKLAPSIASPS